MPGVSRDHAAFISHTLILFGFVAGATYAGTSGLFAAYLAGLSISWWDTELSVAATADDRHTSTEETNEAGQLGRIRLTEASITMQRDEGYEDASDDTSLQSIDTEESRLIEEAPSIGSIDGSTSTLAEPTGLWIYDKYYSVVVERILKPFFFVRSLFLPRQ